MAAVTSSVKPETQPLLPAKPTLSRRASAFSIDAIIATEPSSQSNTVVASPSSDDAEQSAILG